MSYIVNNEIKYSDSPNLDSFGRLRVSDPFTLFHFTAVVNSGQTKFESYVNNGSLTYNSDKSEIQFNAVSGSTIIREQHGYNVYQPGKSQLILLTGVFGSGVSGVVKKMGYFNNDDGLYFQLSGSTFGVGVRTSTSGTMVDTFIPQTSWNIDTLISGNTLNPSGIHLDIAKTNIYIISFQWLGVGRVIFSLDIDGVIVPVHEILNANNKTSVYMKSGTLPIRYEVTSSSGSDSTFKQICSTVISEGGLTNYGYNVAVSNGLTTKSINSKQSVISVRLAQTFSGVKNRTLAIPVAIELLTTTTSVVGYWELIHQRGYLNENSLGGLPTWNSVPNTPLEYSVDGTTVTGGRVINSGYISTTAQSGSKITDAIIPEDEYMALNLSGNTSDWLHLVVTPSVSSSWSGKILIKTLY